MAGIDVPRRGFIADAAAFAAIRLIAGGSELREYVFEKTVILSIGDSGSIDITPDVKAKLGL